MKTFEKPSAQVVLFGADDVVTASHGPSKAKAGGKLDSTKTDQSELILF